MSDESPAPESAKPQIEVPVEFCPACSTRLELRHCKAVCPRCGYFMSCSEFE